MSKERPWRGRPLNIEAVLQTVPDYSKFHNGATILAGNMLLSSSQSLKHFRRREIGRSPKNRPIEETVLGVHNASFKTLWVGRVHPEEVVGDLTIESRDNYLCRNLDALYISDTKFLSIKNADTDGSALNESWLRGEMDPLKYALGYYRPPIEAQVESVSQPLRETIARYKPEFYYPLHNSAFGNPYFYLSENVPELYGPLRKLVEDHGLHIHTGEPEESGMVKWAEGFYQCPDTPMKQYLENVVSGAFSFYCEVPYFTADELKNDTSSGMTRREMLLAKAQAKEIVVDFMKEQYAILQPRLHDDNNPLKHAVEKRIEDMKGFIDKLRQEAYGNDNKQIMTRAQVYDAVHVTSFFELRQLGQLYRLATDVGEIQQAEKIKNYIKEGIAVINKESQMRPVPIRDLVRMQLGAGLLVQQYIYQRQLALVA